MYRSKDWDRKDREEKKMKKRERESWFREGGAETVIFIPNTHGFELKKMNEGEVSSEGEDSRECWEVHQ